jgi:hypothetical protein
MPETKLFILPSCRDSCLFEESNFTNIFERTCPFSYRFRSQPQILKQPPIRYQITPEITSILCCFARFLSTKLLKHRSFPLQTGADSLSVRTSTIAFLISGYSAQISKWSIDARFGDFQEGCFGMSVLDNAARFCYNQGLKNTNVRKAARYPGTENSLFSGFFAGWF